jgi:hypothetical protein
MSSSHHYTISRLLPTSVSSSRAISLLQEHTNIIALSPLVIEYHALPPSDESTTDSLSKSYSITDRIEYLPFGLYTANVTVTANFTNKDDGVIITKHAPFGITITERWLVQEGLDISAEQATTRELVLKVELIAGKLVLPLFKGMMLKNHDGYIDKMAKVILENSGPGIT